MKKLVFKNIYSLEELKAVLPLWAEDSYSISVGKYGYLHDTGIEITLTPIDQYNEPTGWDTIEQDFTKMVESCNEAWQYAIDFGYHGV